MSNRISKEGRALMVIEDLKEFGPCLTELQLATLQGLKKTPNFRAILKELSDSGEITVQWAKGSNRQLTRYFCLPNQAPKLEGF